VVVSQVVDASTLGPPSQLSLPLPAKKVSLCGPPVRVSSSAPPSTWSASLVLSPAPPVMRSDPPPPARRSGPEAPSMTSLPLPPVSLLASASPRRVSANGVPRTFSTVRMVPKSMGGTASRCPDRHAAGSCRAHRRADDRRRPPVACGRGGRRGGRRGGCVGLTRREPQCHDRQQPHRLHPLPSATGRRRAHR